MDEKYRERLARCLPLDAAGFDELLDSFSVRRIGAGTVLLREGERAARLYLVIEGCLRAFFIRENGTEITSQFFIEGQMVSSFESAVTGAPSRVYIDAVEDSAIGSIGMKSLERVILKHGAVRDHFNLYLVSRLIYYMNLHASFILDNPETRYRKLVRDNPELVSRLPQQYIASYLGITPVSLSRIRGRLKKQIEGAPKDP